jgi:hypothetical protein
VLSQVFIEYYMQRAILAALLAPDSFATFLKRMSFESRLALAQALGAGYEPRSIDSLKKLAEIRNNLAHRLGHELTEAQVNDLVGRLPLDIQGIVEQWGVELGGGWTKRFRDALFALVVHVRIRTAEMKVRWDALRPEVARGMNLNLPFQVDDVPLAFVEDVEPT